MECENKYCEEKFEQIEKRLNIKSEMIDKHETSIEVLKTNMSNLTQSLNGLTKALWGVAGTIVVALFSFFVWYIQNLGR